ncbi:cytochrome b [Alkalimarinus sediminis]|uniref:Cytochrome b n=1 Tax=Alkalimarinus sediminis TaxID=1632866 RepID=A0A9E8HIX5_9ALTE|nr:cytochrome b [Alkalimarinus sediminis]UZW73548.1 cytochrome b [Alkalimarinus sediminis]
MNIRNSQSEWGALSIAVHWVVAVVVFGLFGVGLYMVELDYYDSMYRTAPFVHKSVGVLLFLLMAFRLFWRFVSPAPASLATHKNWEKKLAHIVHIALYLLLFVIMVSGYLISTADGRPVSVFGWFEVPAIISGIDNQEDIAGEVHEILAYVLIAIVGFHAIGALKHHFLDKDRTVLRMLGLRKQDK